MHLCCLSSCSTAQAKNRYWHEMIGIAFVPSKKIQQFKDELLAMYAITVKKLHISYILELFCANMRIIIQINIT